MCFFLQLPLQGLLSQTALDHLLFLRLLWWKSDWHGALDALGEAVFILLFVAIAFDYNFEILVFVAFF